MKLCTGYLNPRTEEDIRIRFKNTCSYELLAASNSSVTFSSDTITIARLARAKEVTALLLVEGKTFELSDIDGFESKATVGKVVEKPEQAFSPLDLIAVPFWLILFGAPFFFGTWFGKTTNISALDFIEEQVELLIPSKQLAGFSVTTSERYSKGGIAKATADGRIQLKIAEVVRRGDILHITGQIGNNTKQTLKVDFVNAASSANERGPLSWADSRTDDIFIAPSASKSFQIKVFLPESTALKEVEITYIINLDQGSIHAAQRIAFD